GSSGPWSFVHRSWPTTLRRWCFRSSFQLQDEGPRTRNQEPDLERETGIEPATNSLEGCDSTTELLPPSRLASTAHSALWRTSPPSRYSRRSRRRLSFPAPRDPRRLPNRSSRGERRLVARGGFEPPKPLGRQIYSLLRLTASLPRRLSV